jgi:ABC-type antimicrobial peptide transport system permease subunit
LNLGLVLKRIRREWRHLAVLTISLSLVTAFFALGPLYVRAMIQAGLQYTLSTGKADSMSLTFVSPSAYRPESWNLVNDQLGPLAAGLVRISRSASAFGGFNYTYGEPTTEFTPRSEIGYRVYAFSNLRAIVKLVDGRWPNRLPPPDSPERSAATTEEQIARGIGMYSRGDVEAVIMPEVARMARLQLDSRFVVGEIPANHVVVHVVGIVEAVNPDDPIWVGNDSALTGETVSGGIGQQRYNMGFFVTEGAYSDWLARATTQVQGGENNSYIWQIRLNPQTINADNIDDMRRRIGFLVNQMAADYPGLINFNPLLKLLNSYTSRVSSTQGPVLLLSAAILLLMLYHLTTTVGLALEQQMSEWASLSSRGASTSQLVMLQGLTMILLGLVGLTVGPLLAALALEALSRIGPLAASTGGAVPIAGIPLVSYQLSTIAAAASVIVLTIPALRAARRSLAQFKQIVARPPGRPAWAWLKLDFTLIICGLGFMARLLFFVGGDLGQTLAALLNDPRSLILLILDRVSRSGGLSDPLNLIGPVLLLTGIALLWLRLFPSLIRLIGGFLTRRNGLTGPLAIWNVARDPDHYAHLVLLLIGTLALGTAALALGSTRDQGLWAAARLDIGGAARVDLDPKTAQLDQINWLSLPDASGAAVLTRAETEYRTGRDQIFMAGLDPVEIDKVFPELSDTVKALIRPPSRQAGPVPVIMSARMAEDEGRATRADRLPLQIGTEGEVELLLPGDRTTMLKYRIAGIARTFPTLAANQHFLIMNAADLTQTFNRAVAAADRIAPNQVWLELGVREPAAGFEDTIRSAPGVTGVTLAWDRYNQLLREPLPAAIAGMLYAGFWISLLLSLLDFGFYLATTARRRSLSFAVLQALGWNPGHIWGLLVTEQATLILPALLVGVALGAALAYVMLPFLALIGGETLKLPVTNLIGLLLTLLAGFGMLLLGTAWWLRRLSVNQVLRLGEE